MTLEDLEMYYMSHMDNFLYFYGAFATFFEDMRTEFENNDRIPPLG